MKKHLLIISVLAPLLMCAFAYAGLLPGQHSDGNSPHEKEKVSQWMKAQPVQFLENKGQMTDMDGKPVPFVLFKAEAPGMDMYITEKGLTYVFNKFHKEEVKEEEKTEADKAEEQFRKKKEKKKWITWDRIDMQLGNASIKKENIKKETSSGTDFNYFFGHCPDGIYGVKQYEKITITEVYPGIDWVFYNSTDKGFKYDFIVHPGADPKQIELIYSSLNPLQLDKEGNINIKTEIGALTENAPYSYIRETNQEVASQFQITNIQHINRDSVQYYQTTVALKLSTFNFQLGTLIIDPQLFWATFFGGNGDDGPLSITTDPTGNVFATGYHVSLNFPLQNAGTYFQGVYGGGNSDAFIVKFSNIGVLLWSTHYGGEAVEQGSSIATDRNGNVFITGGTFSTNFPVQDAGLGTYFQGVHAGGSDAFILKFDNAGNRLWATYYGGNGMDGANSIDRDEDGNVFITGLTFSTNFPVQDAGLGTYFQGVHAGGGFDAFILKFDNAGNRFWATYYGGDMSDRPTTIATDGIGNLYVTGYTNSTNFPVQNAGIGSFFQGAYAGDTDAFILKFDNAGNRLWATYYGGSEEDWGYSIAGDDSGNVFITGGTESTNFPVQLSPTPGAFFQGTVSSAPDAFILKFDNAGNRLWATYYGGNGSERENNWRDVHDELVIDACGTVYMSFETSSTNMLTRQSCDGGYYDNTFNGGGADNFIAHFSNSGVLLWATYLGGNGGEGLSPLALDNAGSLFVSGELGPAIIPSTYPLTNPGGGAYYSPIYNGGGADGFIVKFAKIPFTLSTEVNDDCGCDGSATVTVNSGCAPYNYLWSNGQTTQTATGLCADSSYTVTVTDIACSMGTASVTIEPVTLKPVANFEMIPPKFAPLSNPVILFTDQSTGADQWYWNFGDALNSFSTLKNPSFTYADTGTYKVTLFVINNDGCSDSTYQTIYIESEYSLYIPNAFTPDNDGLNDLFYPKGTGFDFIEMTIYNRWGEKVAHPNPSRGEGLWDGTINGKDSAPQGIYVYKIWVKDFKGKTHYYVGNVTLIK